MDDHARKPARLAEIECDLGRLRSQHDLAMSVFKFDEASALQRRIASLEEERRHLAADQPAPPALPEPPAGVVPMLARSRRVRRRR